jgi:outer membrane receptor for ferrienterochelin and colicin
MRIPRATIFFVLVPLILAIPLYSQSITGSLVGTVTSDGSPLPGVSITVSSPALQGTRTAISGEGGGYFFPSLPPGIYTATFELSGLQRVAKKVTVSVSQTSRADVTMTVAAVRESISVTAAAPAVAESTTVASNFTSAQINELPIGRTIDSVTLMAPGVNSAGPNGQIVISGAGSYDSLFLVDGVVVNENLRGQPQPLYIEDAIQETTVLTGGISAEFGRFTGGVVNSLTKSGGNDFSGSFRDAMTNPSWSAVTAYPGQVKPISSLNSAYEGTFGGRLLRDRLWFFGAGRYTKSEGSNQTTLTNIPYVSTSTNRRFETKLTGQLNAQNSFVGTYIDNRDRTDNYRSGGSIVDLASLAPYSAPRSLLSLNYNGIASQNWLLEGQFSRMRYRWTNGAENRDLILGTLLIDDNQGVRGWSPTFCGSPCPPKQRNNKGWSAKSSYFLSTPWTGNHNLVGGYDEFHQLRNENNFQSGSDFRIHGTFFFINGQENFGVDPESGAQIEWDPVSNLSRTSDFAVKSLFFNDKWDLNKNWSFNVGVRYDKDSGSDQAGNKTVDDSAFSPRLAANFDPTGSGRHRISLSYGRYVSKVDQGPADSTSSSGRYSSYYWDYSGPALNSALGSTPSSQIVPIPQVIQQVFNWFQSVGGTNNMQYLASAWIPGVSSRFDRSLKAPYMDEKTLGYSLTFGPSGYVRADLIDRKWAAFYVTTRTIQTGKAIGPQGSLFDQGVIENASSGLSRKYQGLQLQGSYRIAKPFSLGANYTYSKLRGNVEGETPSFATGTTDYNNYPEYTNFAQYNPTGYLGADMRHRLNAWAQYDLPTPIGRFNLSLLQRYHSAQSYSATGTIDIRAGVSNGPVNGIVNPGYVTPPSYVNYFFGDRGALRVNNISSTDLGINWYAPPISSASFFVEGDVINIFNQQGIENPTYINQSVLTRRQSTCIQSGSTSRCLAFNPFTDTPKLGVNYQYGPIFGQPTSTFAYQTPRTYRVSVGVRF